MKYIIILFFLLSVTLSLVAQDIKKVDIDEIERILNNAFYNGLMVGISDPNIDEQKALQQAWIRAKMLQKCADNIKIKIDTDNKVFESNKGKDVKQTNSWEREVYIFYQESELPDLDAKQICKTKAGEIIVIYDQNNELEKQITNFELHYEERSYGENSYKDLHIWHKQNAKVTQWYWDRGRCSGSRKRYKDVESAFRYYDQKNKNPIDEESWHILNQDLWIKRIPKIKDPHERVIVSKNRFSSFANLDFGLWNGLINAFMVEVTKKHYTESITGRYAKEIEFDNHVEVEQYLKKSQYAKDYLQGKITLKGCSITPFGIELETKAELREVVYVSDVSFKQEQDKVKVYFKLNEKCSGFKYHISTDGGKNFKKVAETNKEYKPDSYTWTYDLSSQGNTIEDNVMFKVECIIND